MFPNSFLINWIHSYPVLACNTTKQTKYILTTKFWRKWYSLQKRIQIRSSRTILQLGRKFVFSLLILTLKSASPILYHLHFLLHLTSRKENRLRNANIFSSFRNNNYTSELLSDPPPKLEVGNEAYQWACKLQNQSRIGRYVKYDTLYHTDL